MKELQITLARVNLNNLIVKYILKAKLSGLSDLNREMVLRHAEELEDVLNLIKMLDKENKDLFKINTELSLEIMRLKKAEEKEEIFEL